MLSYVNEDDRQDDVNAVLKALEVSRPYGHQSDFREGLLLVAFALNRLRS